MALTNKNTINEFIERLASGDPTPGGGGASALCGALAAALGSMVCNLTLGRKKYAEVQEDITLIVNESGKLKESFLMLIEKDAELFEPLAAAYGLPKETDEQKVRRDAIMEKALYDACKAPVEMLETTQKTIDLLEELEQKGSRIALSDVGVAAALAEAAVKGACLNVYINTALMKNT